MNLGVVSATKSFIFSPGFFINWSDDFSIEFIVLRKKISKLLPRIFEIDFFIIYICFERVIITPINTTIDSNDFVLESLFAKCKTSGLKVVFHRRNLI